MIRFIGRLEFFLQIVARDVVNKPVQHYPLCQLRDKGQIRDRLLRETWSTSLFSTTLSVNLEIKDRLETGRKFFMTSLSNEGFFSKGVTSAAFIFVGTIPVDMDKLTMFVMFVMFGRLGRLGRLV